MKLQITHPTYRLLLVTMLIILMDLAACRETSDSPTFAPTATRTLRTGPLNLFSANATTPMPTGTPAFTATALPSLTPTPRIHEVKKGEDMFGIAYLYGITLEELKTANPNIQPESMSIGALLIIPESSTVFKETTETQLTPSLTPLAVTTDNLFCAPLNDGSLWCSLPVTNPYDYGLEGVIAVFHITDTQTLQVTSQRAFPPLDILLPGQTLPLIALFPAPLPLSYQLSAEILSSLPNPSDGRYLNARLENQKVFLAKDNLSARINTDIYLEQPGQTAQRIWIAATAYDAQNNIIGLRHWEMLAGETLKSGQVLSAEFFIYSSIGEIEKIELAVEARP